MVNVGVSSSCERTEKPTLLLLLLPARSCEDPCQTSCKLRCDRWCEHARCAAKCSAAAPGHASCDRACALRLPCGHDCAGFCGEECPRACAACDGTAAEQRYDTDTDMLKPQCFFSFYPSVKFDNITSQHRALW